MHTINITMEEEVKLNTKHIKQKLVDILEKDVEYGAAGQDEKTTEENHGCSEGGYTEGWRDREYGEVEADESLWRPRVGYI